MHLSYQDRERLDAALACLYAALEQPEKYADTFREARKLLHRSGRSKPRDRTVQIENRRQTEESKRRRMVFRFEHQITRLSFCIIGEDVLLRETGYKKASFKVMMSKFENCLPYQKATNGPYYISKLPLPATIDELEKADTAEGCLTRMDAALNGA